MDFEVTEYSDISLVGDEPFIIQKTFLKVMSMFVRIELME